MDVGAILCKPGDECPASGNAHDCYSFPQSVSHVDDSISKCRDVFCVEIDESLRHAVCEPMVGHARDQNIVAGLKVLLTDFIKLFGAIGKTVDQDNDVLGLFSMVTLLANLHARRQKLPVQQSAWYPKKLPTFSDALALVKETLLLKHCFPTSFFRVHVRKSYRARAIYNYSRALNTFSRLSFG